VSVRAAVVAVLLGSWIIPAAARAQCRVSDLICGGDALTATTATFEHHCSDVVMSVADLSYDVPAGKLHMSYSETMQVAISLHDDFTVTGIPDGTPVPLHVRLRYAGTGSGYGGPYPGAGGTMRVALLDPLPGEAPAAKSYGLVFALVNAAPFADSLDFTFTRPAGTPFGLEIHGDAWYGYNLINDASFAFLDLPPGAHVGSCLGYRQEQPTPAIPRSWGSLKAAYR
jgi:hypothetical protein